MPEINMNIDLNELQRASKESMWSGRNALFKGPNFAVAIEAFWVSRPWLALLAFSSHVCYFPSSLLSYQRLVLPIYLAGAPQSPSQCIRAMLTSTKARSISTGMSPHFFAIIKCDMKPFHRYMSLGTIGTLATAIYGKLRDTKMNVPSLLTLVVPDLPSRRYYSFQVLGVSK